MIILRKASLKTNIMTCFGQQTMIQLMTETQYLSNLMEFKHHPVERKKEEA